MLTKAQQHDPIGVRVFKLPPALRQDYDEHRAECDASIARHVAAGGPGAAYAALLDGNLSLPPMPQSVERALWPDGKPTVTLPAECSLIEASRRYGDMILEDATDVR